jgi:hypothetical protein
MQKKNMNEEKYNGIMHEDIVQEGTIRSREDD